MAAVKDHFGDTLEIYCGDKAPESSIKVLDSTVLDCNVLRNRILPGAIVLQNIPVSPYLRADVLLLDLNPRMPLVWLLLVVRRLLGKRTILWGHAFPRGGRRSKSERLRSIMRQLSSGLVAYTRSQASELALIHPNLPIWAAPNALYPKSAFTFASQRVRKSFIYVGRLHADKKPLLMIEGFEKAHAVNSSLRLLIVGDGPLGPGVRRHVEMSTAKDAIQIFGHIEDYSALRELYAQSIASISPGYVGLSVTQSLSFGVPMIISRDEPHAPELEAVEEGNNAVFFETDSAQSLGMKMLEVVSQQERWSARGPQIARNCAENYSVEAMVAGLVAAMEDEAA